MNLAYSLIAYVIILVVVITVHEFSHAWAGHMLGDITAKREGRLTLNPLAHIDPFMTLLLPVALILLGSPVVFGAAKPVPFNPYAVRYGKWGAALVALAGPASNFLMAAFVGLYLRIFPIQGIPGEFLLQFVLINIAFFVFNMIPFPPLDGSRLLYAIMPPSVTDIMDKIEHYGLMAVFIFLLLFYKFLAPFMNAVVYGISGFLLGHPIALT